MQALKGLLWKDHGRNAANVLSPTNKAVKRNAQASIYRAMSQSAKASREIDETNLGAVKCNTQFDLLTNIGQADLHQIPNKAGENF